MSELKVYRDPKDGLAYREFYEKSEADKVIAELKQKINEAQTELELWRDGSIISEAHQKELDGKRHSDYKRCLAMAKWCEATALWCYQAANTLPAGFHATLYGKPVMIEPARLFKRYELLSKWNKRCLALAEEPTWTKFLQLIHKEAK